jgi:biotin synthase
MTQKVFLCSICNINSGTCNEDCHFCSQSVRYKANIQRYQKKPIEEILNEARRLESLGALGFCLVTAHKGLEDKTLEFVCTVARTLTKEVPRLRLIGCNGTATQEQLQELKTAGIVAYNHNLETSREFYPRVCTTHSWEERWETCENVNAVGLKLISGGIFGMGESPEDRLSMLHALKALNPISVPLNFYHHNPVLPLQPNPLSVEEALELITLARNVLDTTDRIMVAGGRERMFGDRQKEIFGAGANSIVLGNYLTTQGEEVHTDLAMLKQLGLEIALTP